MTVEKHTISCIVNDNPGVLVNIAASFSEKGVNITTLDSGEPDEGKSRVTVVVKCTENVVSEVMEDLRGLPDVIAVDDLDSGDLIERQLMLVRVKAEGEEIARIMQYVEMFRATIAGCADILVVPGIETGNVLYKCLQLYCGVTFASVVTGACKPIAVPSRSDSSITKLASIALGCLLSGEPCLRS